MSDTTPSRVRRIVPFDTSALLARLGRAKTLARDYGITHTRYAESVWQTHIDTIIAAQEASAAATLTRAKYGQVKLVTVPRAGQLLARLRAVIIGQLGRDHPDVVGELAQHLTGRSGQLVDHLRALWGYCRDHTADVTLAPTLLSQPFDAIITDLTTYGADHIAEKRTAEIEAANHCRRVENAAWDDLVQVAAYAIAEYERGDAARDAFADLTRVVRTARVVMSVVSTPTSTTVAV